MEMDVQVVEVARLQAKDAQAFRSLIERLQQPITGYLYRLVRDYEVALDLSQDTFLQVYKEIEKTSVDLALDAWIYRIATNYGLQYLNRKRLRQIVHFSANPTSSLEDGIATMQIEHEDANILQLIALGPSVEEQAETRILVEQTLALLRPKDAACLQLHFANGLTYEQIGKLIAITPEAARKRVARGVEKFRAVYARNSIEEYPEKEE
ncbi:RNA polymerase sigma factor [Tengunoibacter tsumagoiensis]|uniref:RNA polymerase sigma factor n=1 Tax=Tengunoibacter tsumagoiensis TaxID=2014871 RepID=A0A401ZVS7_9CHLR|nr:RNA polymerase sigma factor [Tengunoibacter tsumagoiensis]GCE10947.1 RNA polymerase sigma factor [Tengunoibacter tsumagoiensis]